MRPQTITTPTKDNPFGSRGLLKKEMRFFEQNLDSFMQDYAGKFVLIKGDHVEGFYDDENEALKIATKKYALTGSYLLTKVTREKELLHIPAVTHGLMHVNF